MQLNSIEEILQDIHQGKPVILMDDEGRENEGDLIVAAQKITPEIVNFMVREARGLLCLTLTGERCDFFGLPAMVGSAENKSAFNTPFTVSIEAANGVTSGISAHDRARTILTAVDQESSPIDIVQPGHIFPLRARAGGVLSRAGHTEAGCDLSRLAGLSPAAAIIEIMNEDGTMARRPSLERFAEKHQLKIGAIVDLIHYRIANETIIDKQQERVINTHVGRFNLTIYQDRAKNLKHLALSKGEITTDTPTFVRVQTVELFRDLLGVHQGAGVPCWSLQGAMAKIAEMGAGVLVLLNSGNNLNLEMELECFTDSNKQVHSQEILEPHLVGGISLQILRSLNVGKINLLGTPDQLTSLSEQGLDIVDCVSFRE